MRSSRARRPGSGRTPAAPRSDMEDEADDGLWRPKLEMVVGTKNYYSSSGAPPFDTSVSPLRAAQSATSSSAQGAGHAAVVQIKLADQLPQMSNAVPQTGSGQGQQMHGSAQQMPDGFNWGWDHPQDMQMNWLPPPAEDQMDQGWSWPCDGSNELMGAGWTPPPDFFETPQKMQSRVTDEWTPPKPDFALGMMPQEQQALQELWQWEASLEIGADPFATPMVPVGMPFVPPLPAGSGTTTPPLTPRQKKAPNPMASPATLKTPNTRAYARVPMSAGGNTELPATPQLHRWIQETPSPQRMYLAAPSNRVPFGEIPASVFPLPETEPPPWT